MARKQSGNAPRGAQRRPEASKTQTSPEMGRARLAQRPERRTTLRGEDAMATWHLQRLRRDLTLTAYETATLKAYVSRSRTSAGGVFTYGSQSVRVRPVVRSLLVALWAADGHMLSVQAVCETLYGHPVSLAAVRQTTFRANRVFERAGCPLVVRCHASKVFVRVNGKPFAGALI